MNVSSWTLSDDLPLWAVLAIAAVFAASLVLLAFELRQRERYGSWIAASGLLMFGWAVRAR